MGEKTYLRRNGLWEKTSPNNLVCGNQAHLWHLRSSSMAPNDGRDEYGELESSNRDGREGGFCTEKTNCLNWFGVWAI